MFLLHEPRLPYNRSHKRLIDFGKSVAKVGSYDAFFLDTNFIVNAIDRHAKFHKACRDFFRYLIQKQVNMYVSEVVTTEVMHVLARSIFIEEEYRLHDGRFISNEEEKARTVRRLHSNWSDKSKTGESFLQYYNGQAKNLFQPILELDHIMYADTRKRNAIMSLDLAAGLGLHSADAMIALLSWTLPIRGLITLDSDMRRLDEHLPIFTTYATNEMYDEASMQQEYARS